MATDLQMLDAPASFHLPSPTDTQARLSAISEFQRACHQYLQPNLDYGVIPGTDRPTLLKPGAEKICRLLSVADTYETTDRVLDWEKGFFHFEVKCRLVYIQTGEVVVEGVGECNSMESRYRWRWLWPNQLEDLGISPSGLRTRTTRNGGLQYRLENDDIYSQVNTLLKMAKKRALVDAALSAGRLSDVFTQDLDDIPVAQTADRPPQREAQSKRPAKGGGPDYQQFFAYAKTEHGMDPKAALATLGVSKWEDWTKGGGDLESAKAKLQPTDEEPLVESEESEGQDADFLDAAERIRQEGLIPPDEDVIE